MAQNNSLDSQLLQILKKIKDRTTLEDVGDFVLDMIFNRVRGEGNGVKYPGANKSKLAPLSPAYIKQRARDKRLHPDTTPSTSNLTRTGKMLDALTKEISDGQLSIVIRKPKELLKAMYTNDARPWVNLSKGEATAIRDFIEKYLADKI